MTILGIDVGNSDTKSQNTIFPSGYEGPYSFQPSFSSDCLKFEGKYYTPSDERLFYLQDKTVDERCIILTLISIAKELILQFSASPDAERTSIQKSISEIRHIALGAGLPVAHYKKKYIENLLAYYQRYMGSGITFSYNDYCFSFIMDACRIFPQGGAAAACSSNKIAAVYNTYYVIDIGGYTVDVAQFKNDIPSRDRLSLEMGIITLYDSIIEKVFTECDIQIDYDSAEAVLHGQNTILPEKAIGIIKELAYKHAGNILNYLRQQKIHFDSHPCLFVGGGSVMLKDSIMNNPLIRRDAVQFITDTRANAKGYARLMSMEYPQETPA